MLTLEFEARLTPDGTLAVPKEIATPYTDRTADSRDRAR